jgi:hypothetical protein
MFKVKHERTADCVVAGFRWHKKARWSARCCLGSTTSTVSCSTWACRPRSRCSGGTSCWTSLPLPAGGGRRPSPAGEVRPDQVPGALSRWNANKDLLWEPLAPELVVEVAYDHMEGRRFRYTAQFRRWRPDRDPRSCTYEQLERPVGFDLSDILAGGSGIPGPKLQATSSVSGKNRDRARRWHRALLQINSRTRVSETDRWCPLLSGGPCPRCAPRSGPRQRTGMTGSRACDAKQWQDAAAMLRSPWACRMPMARVAQAGHGAAAEMTSVRQPL